MVDAAQRRLAAIVSADVAGYSRLMGDDEGGTLAALKAHRAELIDPAVAAHGGRIVKTTGDGLLLEFASVVAAVACGVAIQDGMAARSDEIADDRAIRLRIGVHLGDVIADGDDIFGDGVNIAARLQELCDPGGVAVSAVVHDYLDTAAARGFVDIGKRELKNIRRPVHVWQRQSAPTVARPATAPDRPSIAVLPFDNMSGDPGQDYFADGITEEIIASLARYREVHVIARNSTFAYRGQAGDVRRIGRDLGAQYILEGSMRGNQRRIRITAQLIEAGTGNHLWSERYDRPLDDIFDLQDEIAALVASTIASEVREDTARQAARRATVGLTAWDLHAKAYWYLDRVSTADMVQAQALCRQAIELEPTYAHAYVTLSLAYGIEARSANVRPSRPRAELVADAEAAARRAIELDSGSYLSRKALGNALFVAGRHEAALGEHEMAVRLNPYDPHCHGALGLTLAYMGAAHSARADEHLERAITLSPHDRAIDWWVHGLATAAFMREDYDAAIAWAQRMGQHGRRGIALFMHLAICHGLKGDLPAARDAMTSLRQAAPDMTLASERDRLAVAFRQPADLELYLEGLRRAGLPEA